MFQEQARVERYKVTKSLLGHKLAESGSISTHMLRKTSDVEKLEKLDCPLSKEFCYGHNPELTSSQLFGVHHELPYAWNG